MDIEGKRMETFRGKMYPLRKKEIGILLLKNKMLEIRNSLNELRNLLGIIQIRNIKLE